VQFDDERERVARAQRGEPQAFRWLVERHQGRAFGLALRILRSGPDAEDAVQEAFVKAWQALPAFRGDASFSTWLHRIVARQSFDRLEQLKRRRVRETELDHAGEVPATQAADSEATWRARRLEALMEKLSAQQRAVLTLYYLEDHSVEQVAATLAVPENTVKTHLSRARSALREAWMKGEES
jgi:RNA polymerase sigma-70 factor (ECF subfamily)